MQRERLRIARPVAKLKEGRTDWYKVTNLATGAAEISIYDEVGYFGVTAAAFIDELNAIKSDTITLRLSSPGGEVFDGINIYNALAKHPAHIDVQIDSLAASIASVIAMAGDTITMSAAAQMMIHDGFTMCAGPADEMRATADQLDMASDTIASVYAARTGTPATTWRAAMRKETWYTADKALAAGLIDKIAPLKGRPDVATASAATTWDLSVFKHTPQPLLNAAASGGYKPKPYKREDYENVKCPACGKYSDDDAQNCGQCGAKLAGRDDVQTDDSGESMTDRAKAALIAAGLDPAMLRDAPPVTPQAAVVPVVAVLPAVPIAEVVVSPTDADKPEVDGGAWDAAKAWAAGANADDPAAFYEGICAGKKSGDPSTQAAWALPYRYAPGDAPNAAGVRAALARLDQTQGLINKTAAQETLEAAMKKINPDYKPGNVDAGLLSAALTQSLIGGMK